MPGPPPEGLGYSPGTTVSEPGPFWTATIGTTILYRSSDQHHAPLVFDNTTGNSLLGAEDLDLGFGAGVRLSLERHYQLWDLEFIYYGVGDWGVSRMVSDPGNLSVPLLTGQTLDSANATYDSTLNSLELNLKRHLTDRLTALIGFRWIERDDLFTIGGSSASFLGTNSVETDNNLLGLQIGLEGKLWEDKEHFSIDGFVKAGVYGNYLHTHQVFDTSESYWGYDQNNGHTSLAAEAGLTATWRVSPYLALKVGYEVLVLDGIALAPDMLTGIGPFQSTALYHGAIVAAQFDW
jgi:hypothetical protein